ncbi:protein kinase [Streptomyces sp. HNM0574]|uniref:protein kinase domain-containing protein n=1 Tax=Streptomyces sp. HNM0574 TaxID=2714954 RepID=UPI00146D8489|nr:protein kinase [Streptomyces sp. HNM0574]NLU66828.1 protein kinase [Streptomyces sp. HNM0574]
MSHAAGGPATDGFAVRVPHGYRVGPWEVRQPLASGAFGSVYEAVRVPGAGREDVPDVAALKFLATGTRTPRQLRHLRDLAERELQLHRTLRRPRLIRMFEALTVDDAASPELDGSTVLVLERAETSLDRLLAASPAPAAGPALLAQICEGLAQLHTAGWVHGDLKPSNVLLMPDGGARLGDFNLASELEGTHAYAPAFATPDYTPPELLWSEIDERGQRIRTTADIWAFGVLAHLVLTGSLPWPGGTPSARRDAALRYARGTDALRLSPELPDAWQQIVTDCLAPAHAPRAAHEATRLLERLRPLAGEDGPDPGHLAALRTLTAAGPGTDDAPTQPPSATPATPAAPSAPSEDTAPPPARPHRRRNVLVAGAAAAAVLAGALGYVAGERPAALFGPEGREGGNSAGTTGGPAEKGRGGPRYGAAELRVDAGVPVRYRKLIVDSAHSCLEPDVTPALIAALLKTESGFDPHLSDPGTGRSGEYGIARWSPHVLLHYLDEKDRPANGGPPKPPFPPEVSIPAVGRYLCQIAPRLRPGLDGDPRVLIAASYRTSATTVNREGGVPDRHRGYADRIERHLKEYTPAGAR